MRNGMRTLLGALLLLGAGACKDKSATGPSYDAVKVVELEIADADLLVGEYTDAVAKLWNADGDRLTGRTLAWISTQPAVVRVDSRGRLAAVAPGTATIIVSSQGRSASRLVTVSPAGVTTLTVTSPSAGLQVGATVQLAAAHRDPAGALLPITGLLWTSGSPTIATISATGLVTGVAPGIVIMTASIGGRHATVTLTVSAAGQGVPVVGAVTVQIPAYTLTVGEAVQGSATVVDANGIALSGQPVVWASQHPVVATVSAGGLITAVAPGAATITATSGGVTGSVQIVVTAVPAAGVAPVATVALSAPSTTVVVGGTVQLTAVLRDAGNGLLDGRAVVWSTSASAVATVGADGLVVGVAPGTAEITVTSEGKSATILITVAPAVDPSANVVASVSLSGGASILVVGGSTTISATALNAGGAALPGRIIAWSSGTPAVATVSATGVVTAVAPGTAEITATVEGRSASRTITVLPVPVASVVLAPTTLTLVAGQQVPVVATPLSGGGAVLTGRVVAWQSSAPAVATVSASGQVTAQAVGQATITATCEGVTAQVTVTVTAVPVHSVTVSAGTVNLTVGGGQLVSVTPLDLGGLPLLDRVVQWTVGDPSIVSGVFNGVQATLTALQAGSTTVTATVEGKSVQITVTVAAAPSPTLSCGQVAGASIIASGGLFLGRLTVSTDLLSVLNPLGLHGSLVGALSINNVLGLYGSLSGALSAKNPGAATPPTLVRDGVTIGYLTTNPLKTPGITPAAVQACVFF